MTDDAWNNDVTRESVTVREGNPNAGEDGLTAREGEPLGAVNEPGSAFVGSALLPSLSTRFVVVKDLEPGGEANLLLVRDPVGVLWVVKQYRRRGWSPAADVLDRLADARADHSLDSWRQDPSVRGVVWLQESGIDPATELFFEVMEYVDGGTLADRVAQWPASDLVRALTDAVSAFHLLVGAHRDIKPANALVRSAEEPVLVLVDLGLARDVGEGSKRFSKRDGSAAYQAPEASHGLVSRAGDWWSVGMILAEVALGFHPFARGDGSLLPDEVIHAELAQRDVPHLDAIAEDRVRLLCRGLLTRDADRRWGKAEVRAWLRGESPAVASGIATLGSGTVAPQRARTVLFGGMENDTPRSLAAAFAADPGRAGELLFLARDQVLLEDLRLLLGAHGLQEAQGYVSSYRSGAWQPAFLRLLVEMDPELTPELSGQSMTPEALADIAREAIEAGEVTKEQLEAFSWVTDHDLWRIWRRQPGMTESVAAAGRLMRFSAADGVAMCPSAKVDDETTSQYWLERSPLGQVWMLWWAVVPDAAEVLNERLEPLRSRDDVKDQSWWLDLARQVPNATEGQVWKWAVTAWLSWPLALTLQQELDEDAALRRKRRDAERAGRERRAQKAARREARARAQKARRRQIIDEKAGEKAAIEEELDQLRSRILPWKSRRVKELEARLARLYPWDAPGSEFSWDDVAADWIRREDRE